jgi:predicted transcriptional regulator
MNNSITLTDTAIKVNDRTVATIVNKEAYVELILALHEGLRKDESVYLALSTLCQTREGVRTSDVSNYLSMDRSNCTKALERLLEEGRVQVIGSTTPDDAKGRPSRLWRVL